MERTMRLAASSRLGYVIGGLALAALLAGLPAGAHADRIQDVRDAQAAYSQHELYTVFSIDTGLKLVTADQTARASNGAYPPAVRSAHAAMLDAMAAQLGGLQPSRDRLVAAYDEADDGTDRDAFAARYAATQADWQARIAAARAVIAAVPAPAVTAAATGPAMPRAPLPARTAYDQAVFDRGRDFYYSAQFAATAASRAIAAGYDRNANLAWLGAKLEGLRNDYAAWLAEQRNGVVDAYNRTGDVPGRDQFLRDADAYLGQVDRVTTGLSAGVVDGSYVPFDDGQPAPVVAQP